MVPATKDGRVSSCVFGQPEVCQRKKFRRGGGGKKKIPSRESSQTTFFSSAAETTISKKKGIDVGPTPENIYSPTCFLKNPPISPRRYRAKSMKNKENWGGGFFHMGQNK